MFKFDSQTCYHIDYHANIFVFLLSLFLFSIYMRLLYILSTLV